MYYIVFDKREPNLIDKIFLIHPLYFVQFASFIGPTSTHKWFETHVVPRLRVMCACTAGVKKLVCL